MDHVIPKCTAAPTIIRNGPRQRFVLVEQQAAEDENLSFRAAGILLYLLSKPDNWQTRVTDLMRRGRCGKDAVYAGLNELVAAGYAERRTVRENGRIVRREIAISALPIARPASDCPNEETCSYPAFPDEAFPDKENPPRSKEEDLPRIETTEAFVQPVAAPPPEWTNELKTVKATLDEFDAPDGFYDLAFWAKISAAYGPLPDVYYIDELRKYLLWWHQQPPSRRRKAVTRSFTTWLRTEETRAQARAERAREREATNGYHQARR